MFSVVNCTSYASQSVPTLFASKCYVSTGLRFSPKLCIQRAPYPTFGPADAAGRGARRRPPDGEISRRTGPDRGPTLAWTPLDQCRTGRRTADLVPDGAGRSRTAPDGAGPEPDAGRGPRPEPDQKPDQPDATPRTEPDGGRTGSKRVPDKLPARRTERRLGGHIQLSSPARTKRNLPRARENSRQGLL